MKNYLLKKSVREELERRGISYSEYMAERNAVRARGQTGEGNGTHTGAVGSGSHKAGRSHPTTARSHGLTKAVFRSQRGRLQRAGNQPNPVRPPGSSFQPSTLALRLMSSASSITRRLLRQSRPAAMPSVPGHAFSP